jgi:sigma-E factor negative regulatory protein RseC
MKVWSWIPHRGRTSPDGLAEYLLQSRPGDSQGVTAVIVERGNISELRDGRAWVECQSRSACERCARGQGCGGGVLGALLGDRLHTVQVRAIDPDLQVGDQVELGIAPASLLGGASLVYLLPLSGLLAGALVAGYLGGFSNDALTVSGAVVGLLGAGLVSRHIHRDGLARFQPKILRNLGPCEDRQDSAALLARRR